MDFPVAEFNAAVEQWDRETCFHSFPHTILRGAGYERVKAFGKAAVPHLLSKLQEAKAAGDRALPIPTWGIFWLLDELTEQDVFVGEEDSGFRKGSHDGTLEAWLAWGKKAGHLDA